MELFSERGYHGVSMPAVASHLNLSRSTLYFTFGSKPALFAHALRHSCGASRLPGMSEMIDSESARTGLMRVFEVACSADGKRPVCMLRLLIGAMRGLIPDDQELALPIKDTLLDLEARFRKAIERARAATEIAAFVDPDSVARVLLSIYLGSHLLAGCGYDEDARRSAVLHQVHSLLPAPPAAE